MNMNSISSKARIGSNVSLGEYVTISDGVEIGDNSVIESYCHLGYSNGRERGDLIIGRNAHIRSHSICYLGARIGADLVTGHHVIIRENSSIGDGFQLGAGSSVMGKLEIGDHVTTGSRVEIGQKSKVGNFIWIFLNTTLINDKYPPSLEIDGPTIDDFAVIGAHSVIYPGVSVGFDALVGSGCFLSKDLSDLTIAVGNPSREIGPVTRIKLEDGVSAAYPWRHRFQRGYPEELTKKWLREVDAIASMPVNGSCFTESLR